MIYDYSLCVKYHLPELLYPNLYLKLAWPLFADRLLKFDITATLHKKAGPIKLIRCILHMLDIVPLESVYTRLSTELCMLFIYVGGECMQGVSPVYAYE